MAHMFYFDDDCVVIGYVTSMLYRIVLLVFSLGFLQCRGKGSESAPPPTPVKIAEVAENEITTTSEYLATLRSRRTVILQPQIEGQVTKIFAKAGDEVTVGDPIVQIDPARQQAMVSSQQATRAAREAQLAYWKQQSTRLKVLHEGGAVSKQELDQASASLEAAQADVSALEASVRQQEVQLHYYRVAAPVSGTVGDIPVRIGDRVTPQTPLTTLSQSSMLEAYISVPVERSAALRVDMPVRILQTDATVLAETRLSFVSPIVNDDTQSVLVKALLSNDNQLLRPGQFVRALLVWNTHKGITIPVLAVHRINGQYFAFVAENNSSEKSTTKSPSLIAHQRAIEVGELVNNNYVVHSGLKIGERIVIEGVQNIRDGSSLTLQ